MQRSNIAAFALLMGVFFALTFLPADSRAAESETLTEMPVLTLQSVKDDTFPRAFEDYLSDNIAFRSLFIKAARAIESFHGMAASEGLIEKTDSYILWSDRIMEVFHRKPETEANYAALINAVSETLPEDVNIYNIVVPTQAEFFLSEEYRNLTDPQKDSIDHVYGLLDERVKPVDVYSALEPHKDEYIYFRTDHHWTAAGAYYAYQAFCQAAGLETVPLSEYEEKVSEGFLGYLYNQHPSEGLSENADDIHYYTLKDDSFTAEPGLIDEEQSGKYAIFLGGDWPYYTINTSVKNGRTAIVVKDSYANCFVPFLGPHYENIILIDPRYVDPEFEMAREIGKYGQVDLIFMNYAFSTTFDDVVSFIDRLR